MASSVLGDVCASALLPRSVSTLLQRAAGSAGQQVRAGFSGDAARTWCWVMAFGQLALWRHTEGVDARVVTIHLPVQLLNACVAPGQSPSALFVSILRSSQGVTAVVSSPSGLIMAWPNAEFTAEPLIHQLPGAQAAAAMSTPVPASLQITAFTATAPPASSGSLFLAALTQSDGSLHLVHGNQRGMHSRQLAGAAAGAAAPSEQRSVLGVLGHALANVVSDAFHPGARFTKRVPSGRPGVALLAQAVDAHRIHVYVLTDTTLDCWQVSVGLRQSEQLLWSAQTVAAAGSLAGSSVGGATNRALSVTPCEGAAFVLLTLDTPDGTHRAWVHRLAVRGDAPGPTHVTCFEVPPSSHPKLQGATPVVHGIHAAWDGRRVLLEGQRASLHELAVPGGAASPGNDDDPGDETATDEEAPLTCTLVADDPDTLAAAGLQPAAQGAALAQDAVWLLLNATHGVLQLHGGDAVGTVAQPDADALAHGDITNTASSLTLDQRAQALQALDSAVGSAAAVLAARQPLLTLAMGLRRRLTGLGVLASPANAHLLGEYSSSLADALPKQGSRQGLPSSGPEPGEDNLTAGLLAAKQAKHGLLLECLSQAGLLQMLPPDVLRVLVENGEKLAATAAVLALHSQMVATPEGRGALAVQVIHQAGLLCGNSGGHDVLQPTDLFYACPCRSAPALMVALGGAAEAIREQASSGLGRPDHASTSELLQHVLGLVHVLGAVEGAVQRHQQQERASHGVVHASMYRSLGQPSWLVGTQPRGAISTLTLACQAVRGLLLPVSGGSDAYDSVSHLARWMFGCTEVLLSSFAAAVACTEDPDEREAVMRDYAAARLRCLSTLLADARLELELGASLQASSLMLQVQRLSAAHHCHPVLFEACERVDAYPGAHASGGPSLHAHMAGMGAEEGAPPSDTFARYCFQRLVDEKRPADLLQLPSSFYPALQQFLGEQPSLAALLWPLLLRTGQWGPAAMVLAMDAEAKKASWRTQRRLLCLADLAATKAQDGGMQAATGNRLQVLAAQAALQALCGELDGASAADEGDGEALGPDALAAAALEAEQHGAGGRGAVVALQALAAGPPDLLRDRQHEMQQAVRCLLRATDWAALQEGTEGEVDGAARAVQATPLYQGLAALLRALPHCGGSTASEAAREASAWVKAWAKEEGGVQARPAVRAFNLCVQLLRA